MELQDIINSLPIDYKKPYEIVCREDVKKELVDEAIKRIEKNQRLNPIVLNKNMILAGHERYLAMLEKNWKLIPTVQLEDVVAEAARVGYK